MSVDSEWVDKADELAEVLSAREREAATAGMSLVEARMFAEGPFDIAELRRLVELDCPPHLIAAIVL